MSIQSRKKVKCEVETKDEGNGLVLNEFTDEEVTPGPLDKLNRQERDYSQWKHLFVNDDQYEFFLLLPGGDDVKAKILRDAYETANKTTPPEEDDEVFCVPE
jgi:hypothetical protein